MRKEFTAALYTDNRSSEEDIVNFKSILLENGVDPCQHLHYGDPNQVPICISALNTWVTNGKITKFPVLIITKIGARSIFLDSITSENIKKLPIF